MWHSDWRRINKMLRKFYMKSKIREKHLASFIIKNLSNNGMVCAFCCFTWVQSSLQNLVFAPKFNNVKSVLIPCLVVISLHFKFSSGLTNVLLRGFIWKKVNIWSQWSSWEFLPHTHSQIENHVINFHLTFNQLQWQRDDLKSIFCWC